MFTELIFDESATIYVRKNLLKTLAIDVLYTEQVERELFEHFADIEGLPEDIVDGLLMFINYSQRSNVHVPFLLKCFVKYNRRLDHYMIKHTAEELLGVLTGYKAVHELLILIVEMSENRNNELIYYISGVFENWKNRLVIFTRRKKPLFLRTQKKYSMWRR